MEPLLFYVTATSFNHNVVPGEKKSCVYKIKVVKLFFFAGKQDLHEAL